MRSDTSQMPMWLGAELKLIEDVPVHLCDACNTQAFDPGVEAAIRALVATGFPDRLASREVVVPVFQLDNFLVDNNKKVAAE
jgi:YgiT-type zinc finger domain-containing protein